MGISGNGGSVGKVSMPFPRQVSVLCDIKAWTFARCEIVTNEGSSWAVSHP
jgi:hypothetical protein